MNGMQPRTRLIHGGIRRSQFGEVSEALYLTQGYKYANAEQAEARFQECGEFEFTYSRYGNPTVRMFEERMALLEGAEDAFATASGMAAVNGALMSFLKAGDHLVSSRALFGSCRFIVENILPKFGVEVTIVDGTNLEEWRSAIRADTKVVFFETISNPTLEVIDIAAVARIAHDSGAEVVVDNVFATPVFQDSFGLGTDVLIYSATKHIDGQGRCLGGVVLGKRKFIRDTLEPFLKHTGSALSPFNAWVLLKGMETLTLRCHEQARSASFLAESLVGHDKLARVIYPFAEDHPQLGIAKRQMTAGGTVFSVELSGGKDAAFRFVNSLKLLIISNNLGDAKSLVTHPATTTHKRLSEESRMELGITGGLVRISVGLEDPHDLLEDMLQALASA